MGGSLAPPAASDIDADQFAPSVKQPIQDGAGERHWSPIDLRDASNTVRRVRQQDFRRRFQVRHRERPLREWKGNASAQVADNAAESGRALNRRVEVSLVKR